MLFENWLAFKIAFRKKGVVQNTENETREQAFAEFSCVSGGDVYSRLWEKPMLSQKLCK